MVPASDSCCTRGEGMWRPFGSNEGAEVTLERHPDSEWARLLSAVALMDIVLTSRAERLSRCTAPSLEALRSGPCVSCYQLSMMAEQLTLPKRAPEPCDGAGRRRQRERSAARPQLRQSTVSHYRGQDLLCRRQWRRCSSFCRRGAAGRRAPRRRRPYPGS